MTSPGPPSKAEFRRHLRASRPDVSSQAIQSEAIRRHLYDWLCALPAATIAIFSPLPGEPDLLDLSASLARHRWLLPRIAEGTMTFHRFSRVEDLTAGAFGIAEPAADSPPEDLREIDLFLCPGLGFSPSGVRLGRGKGYYDRTLAGARSDAICVGVAFREQILPFLPAEAHDLPMHRLAGPDGLADCV